MSEKYIPRLQKYYESDVINKLKEEFSFSNRMSVPKLEKIVINMGIKEGTTDIKVIEQAKVELLAIAGQSPVITRAKKSVAAFKLREGMPVGLKVTLRKQRMYEFLERLICIAMPRIRDFRGASTKSFDNSGNYSMGLSEQIVFPEVEFDRVKRVQGMDITIVTTASERNQSFKLLEYMGFPFRKAQNG